MTTESLLLAGGIFILRVVGNMMTTLRLVMIVRGQKLLSSLLAALEALIFALALGSVVTNLDDIPTLTAYCVGFAVGGYLGLALEQRLVQRFISVQMISPRRAHEIAVAVRHAGYGATESWGQGADGAVGSVTVVVTQREVRDVIKVANEVDPNVFVMVEELRGITRGHFRFARPER